VLVEVGHQVEPAEVLATRRAARGGTTIAVAARLRRPAADGEQFLVARPGATLDVGDPIADDGRGRLVAAEEPCIFLSYDRRDGLALVAPLGDPQPIVGHVRGEVAAVGADFVEIAVMGALVSGVGGSGPAVHGELHVGVDDPGDELRAQSIDVNATGRILVGGSRASAETLTRARAIGVAGIVLGGALDKELRDFDATQTRRREAGGGDGDLAVLIVSGYGKVGLDADLFAWFRRHEGRVASLFGDEARLYVYEADPPPGRRSLPRTGDRVVARRRPHLGSGGRLVRVLDRAHAVPSGIVTRAGVVRFDDGRSAIVPLANLEAVVADSGD
jgi:hypothetical protein